LCEKQPVTSSTLGLGGGIDNEHTHARGRRIGARAIHA
jgi:hypothetical protein